jgi:hypothetical protein
MKTTISGKKIDIKQGGMELFKVAMQGKIEELGLELNIELAQEKHSIVDNVFDKVANECEKYKVTLNNTQLSTQQLALLVTNVYYSALESLSNEGKVAFVCYIDTSKDKLREFMNKNYNIEDNKVYYKITNKDLLDYIKEKNGVILDKQPVEDISGKMNERID